MTLLAGATIVSAADVKPAPYFLYFGREQCNDIKETT